MLIHEFHSKLTTGKEQSLLFEALRRLRLLTDPCSMVTGTADDPNNQPAGWTVWSDDASDPGFCATAGAA